MRIPDYSGSPAVRRAYLQMAKQYHPDVNQDKEAEEIFKWVNRANETLRNPTSKKIYDQRLKAGYFLEGIQKYSNSKDRRIRVSKERKEAMANKSRAIEIDNYRKSLKKFPLFARFGFFTLLLIYGMFVWYNYWIVNYADYSVYVLTFGVLCTILGIVMLIDTNYKRLRIKQFTRGTASHYERISMWMLVSMIVIVPLIIMKISDYRKQYHLKHYEEYALARVVSGFGTEGMVYHYKIENKIYEKHSDDKDQVYSFDGKSWLIVRYSREDPILSEPVDYIKHAHELFENHR